MTTDYNLLKIFIKVAETSSFTGASKLLKQPKSRVSRAIARLEDNLEVQLIRRTTRKISLTAAGNDFFERISPLLQNLENEITRVSEKDKEMSGTIRMTAPDSIGQSIISKVIAQYSLQYPDVKFETFITNEKLDLIKDNIDIAFRAGKLSDSTMIQRKLVQSRFVLVCSPQYISKRGYPKSKKDLYSHNILSFTPTKNIIDKEFRDLPESLSTDSLSMLRSMASDGLGITMLPEFYCKKYFEEKRLVRILPSWNVATGYIHILYPPAKTLTKKVRIFIEMAKEIFND